MSKQLSFENIPIKTGDSLFIDRLDNTATLQTEIVSIKSNNIEISAPYHETGRAVSFKPGESINAYYWSADGNKYSFQSIVQDNRTFNNTYNILIPKTVKHDGSRKWTRYKPMNMITSFANVARINRVNDSTYVARVINISAGGMLMSSPKRFNIGDELGLGFYIKGTFFTAIGIVKSTSPSKVNIGNTDIAIQFMDYSEADKEYLDSILRYI